MHQRSNRSRFNTVRAASYAIYCALAVAVSIEAFGDELRVLPPAISVSPNYPATFSVALVSETGAMRALDQDASLVIQVESEDVAGLGESNAIHARRVGSTHLIVKYSDQVVRLPIESIADDPIHFDREISAVLSKTGCNLGTCHGNLFGKGGFRLSLRGDDPRFDFDRIVNEFGGRRIDLLEPVKSLVLQKATTEILHQGGKRFDAHSKSFEFLKEWIDQSANWSDSPQLVQLRVGPPYLRMLPGQRSARINVQAEFSDGTVRDVTPWARIEPNVPTGVEVSENGLVQVTKPTDVTFSIAYLNGRSATRIVFLGNSIRDESQQVNFENPIDALVDAQCRELNIAMQPRADASTLVRRMYLVAIGRLPTAVEVREFLNADETTRVEALVDKLLGDPGFDYSWAMRWSDLLRNEDKVMSPKGAALLHDWLRQQCSSDRPIGEWVSELVSGTGSTYENPPASFHRTHRDPMTTAESAGQVFLGVRIQCAKCHNHPFDVWRQDDYYGIAAYFTTIDRKQIDNKPKDELDKHIITGDEIISLGDRKPEIKHPGRSSMVPPSPLRWKSSASFATLPTASQTSVSEATPAPSVLQSFGNWLTRDNDQFDANMANRIWSQYFGRGIVDPPDDFRGSNPATNPMLLKFLAEELRRDQYSLKSLTRKILTSETFARGSFSESMSEEELSAAPYFAGYAIRRLPAEALMDAVCDVTGVASEYRAGKDEEPIVAPKAMMMPGIPKRPGFLSTFGKPNRLLDCECERSNQVTLGQSLALINGVEIREKLVHSGGRIDRLLNESTTDSQVIEELFLTALSRMPTSREIERCERFLMESNEQRRQGIEDLMWSLLNSKEFVMIR